MGKIKILTADVINKIAAGEVIERPASVVKELLENALDAQAGKVEIRIDQGGLERISVRDDGTGLDPSDARLAFERHATSKITSEDELCGVATMGFRGEALPSIASVSRTTLRTSPDRSGQGVVVRYEGGALVEEKPVGLPRGTTVEVDDLFFNTPARRKFLRTAASERARVVETVTAHAMGRPDVHFTLHHGAREVLDLPPVCGMEERALQLLGQDVARHLVPCALQDGTTAVTGLVSLPPFARRNRKTQFFYINGRPFADRGIMHAVTRAYERTLERGAFPVVVLFISEDCRRVDVNVHPAKAEVRFADLSRITGMVHGAIGRALAEKSGPDRSADFRIAPTAPFPREPFPRLEFPGTRPARPDVAQETGPVYALDPPSPLRQDRRPGEAPLVLGQYRQCYILAEMDDALVLIDQHAAHERILYERFTRQRQEGKSASQAYLIPVVVEVPASEAAWLEAQSGRLRDAGIEVEPFGGRSFQVKAAPPELPPEAIAALIAEIAGWGVEPGASLDFFQRLAVSMACHGAIKARTPLSRDKMTYITERLFSCENPLTCPHGRPVILRIDHRSIERNFRRR